jgi:hypothetical protein
MRGLREYNRIIRINMSIIVIFTLFLHILEFSIANMNLKQLLPIDNQIAEMEKYARSKISKFVCSDCYDSNLILTADTAQEDKSPSPFNVFINMTVHKSNPNRIDVAPITHQGPRRVLLERIDEQTKQINDCNKIVKDFADLTSSLKKSNDECELKAHINAFEREERCVKQLEEMRSRDKSDCNTAHEQLTFWKNESKTCFKSSQYVLAEMKECNGTMSRVAASLSSCRSQEAACLADARDLSSTSGLLSRNYASCNASLSRSEAAMQKSMQQVADLSLQLSVLRRLLRDENKEVAALSALREQRRRDAAEAETEVDEVMSFNRGSLILLAMALLLAGYCIRELKGASRVGRAKKSASAEEVVPGPGPGPGPVFLDPIGLSFACCLSGTAPA